MSSELLEVAKAVGSIAKRVRNLETQKNTHSSPIDPGLIVNEIEDALPGAIIDMDCGEYYLDSLVVPPGVTVLGVDAECTIIYLTGEIELSEDVVFKNITVIKVCSSIYPCVAIRGPLTGLRTTKILDSIIMSFNCDLGNAIAVFMKSGTPCHLEISNTVLIGESRAGDGWGLYHGVEGA